MRQKNWKNKIQINRNIEYDTLLSSGNSMGIYFEKNFEKHLIVHFKPLNEDFDKSVFATNKGSLINFERDLIDEDDIEYALDVMSLFNKYPKFVLSEESEIQQIQHLIKLLNNEFCNDSVSYIMLKTLLKVLLLHLIRYQNNGFLEQNVHQKRVFLFLELMEKNFLSETNALFYANEIGISVKRLNQILKEKLNLTAKQVIQQRQITEAKRRLIRGENSTKELAFQFGFDSISSFSRFFKKAVGVSPSVFKQQHTY